MNFYVFCVGSRDEKRCAFFTLAKRWKNEDFPPLFSIFEKKYFSVIKKLFSHINNSPFTIL